MTREKEKVRDRSPMLQGTKQMNCPQNKYYTPTLSNLHRIYLQLCQESKQEDPTNSLGDMEKGQNEVHLKKESEMKGPQHCFKFKFQRKILKIGYLEYYYRKCSNCTCSPCARTFSYVGSSFSKFAFIFQGYFFRCSLLPKDMLIELYCGAFIP